MALAAFVGLAAAAHAQGLPALRLVPDAAAQGRGETVAAATGSVLLAGTNPAALASLDRVQSALAYRRWLEGSGLYALAVAAPLTARSTVGVLATAFDATREAAPADEAPAVQAFSVAVAYAYGRGPVRLGLTTRYFRERDVAGGVAHGLVFDAGAQAVAWAGGVRAGVAVNNIDVGGVDDATFLEAVELPTVLRAGVAVEPLLVAQDAVDLGPIARVLVAADVVRDLTALEGIAARTRVHVGLEVEGFDLVVARAGYLGGDAVRSVTLGLGLRSGAFAVDFGYQPFADGGGTGQGIALRYAPE